MVEVCAGVLIGSEADAEVAAEGKKLTSKRLSITHILSITHKPPDWLKSDQSDPVLPQGSRGQGEGGGVVEGEGAEVGGGGVEDEGGIDVKGEGIEVKGEGAEVKDEGIEVKEVANKVKEGLEVKGGVQVKTRTPKLTTMYVGATDQPSTDLLHQFEACCRFIQQGVELGNILVHCVHGMSRSPTVVLAYLMWKEGRPLQVLLKEVQSKKPDIRPNAGFMKQLNLWGEMKCRINASNKAYKLYRLQHMAQNIKDTDLSSVEIKTAMSADPTVETQDSTAYYKCRKCRRLLFTEGSVLLHEVGRGFDKRPKGQLVGVTDMPTPDLDSTSVRGQRSNAICSSYFIEPVEWMEEMLLGNTEGKVLCPKCEARLGSFSWVGHQCSCGQWVNPSFQIHKAKVDEIRTLTRRKPNTSAQESN